LTSSSIASTFFRKIDLTIEGEGTFAVGGAVPDSSTWAMMLIGFAGLGFCVLAQVARTKRRKAGLKAALLNAAGAKELGC
jgi:hypothetical protein